MRNHFVTNHRNTYPLCKESFKCNVDLQEHMKAMHETLNGRKSNTEKVTYLCHLCSKVFNIQSSFYGISCFFLVSGLSLAGPGAVGALEA